LFPEFSNLLDANQYLVRLSPFFRGTRAAGCRAYDHINGVFVAIDYGHPRQDGLEAMRERVVLYDTAIQRQIEVRGKDALRLCDYLFTRDLSELEVNRARYGFFCRPDGVIITDAVVTRFADDRVWLSPTVADLILWIQGVATARQYDVEIAEAEYATARLEGKRSLDLMRDLVGELYARLPYFRCGRARIADVDVLISKTASGPSPGCDIYVPNGSAMAVWDAIVSAGRRHGLLIKGWDELDNATMMESGVLFFSYTTNYEDRINPLEFWRSFVDLSGDEFIGKAALLEIQASGGPRRRVIGLVGSEHDQGPIIGKLDVKDRNSTVGFTRWIAWSPTLQRNIGYALVEARYAQHEGCAVSVVHPSEEEPMTITALPFVTPRRSS